MFTIETNRQFYELMPRFVEDRHIEYISGRFLSSIERQFEWNGQQFTFVITPAVLHDDHRGGKHHFPGIREQAVEKALRYFASKECPDFSDEESILVISLDKLSRKLSKAVKNQVMTSDEIEKSLQILADTRYQLINDFVETGFYIIEEISRMNLYGVINYRIKLSRIFLGKCESYDCVFSLLARDTNNKK